MAIDKGYTDIISILFKKEANIFEELKVLLGNEGVQIGGINLITTSKSSYVVTNAKEVGNTHIKVPYLQLIAADINSYRKIVGEPEGMGLVNPNIALITILLWKQLCTKYKVPMGEYYHNKMYIGASNAEVLVYTYIARNSKEEISKLVLKKIGIVPKHIYASSLPSIDIVFTTDDYFAYGVADEEEEIKKYIKDLTSHKAITLVGQEIKNILKINFLHPTMKGYNGYGLSRED